MAGPSTPSEVKFEPRPVVTQDRCLGPAAEVPRRRAGRPAVRDLPVARRDHRARQLHGPRPIAVQKPISRGEAHAHRPHPRRHRRVFEAHDPDVPGRGRRDPDGRDRTTRPRSTFDLTPDLIAYQVEVKDVNGFANSTPPRRGIQIAPDDPPVVRLLPERYAEPGTRPSDEDIIEGLPIPIGGQIPIAYTCRSPQGVGRAQLRYRINERGPWVMLPLKTVDADEKSGPFDPTRGTFVNAEYGQQVEFHPMPSPDRDTLPDYLAGGGRFDFQTAELTKITDDGKLAKLEIGDRVEFYVEVFDRNPTPNRPPGRSEARIKEVLSRERGPARGSTRRGRPKARSATWRRNNGTCSSGGKSDEWSAGRGDERRQCGVASRIAFVTLTLTA